MKDNHLSDVCNTKLKDWNINWERRQFETVNVYGWWGHCLVFLVMALLASTARGWSATIRLTSSARVRSMGWVGRRIGVLSRGHFDIPRITKTSIGRHLSVPSTRSFHIDDTAIPWKDYLVEFRGGLLPHHRLAELYDATEVVLGSTIPASRLNWRDVVPEVVSPMAVMGFISLPHNDTIVQTIAQRCALVRRIVDVWGEGETLKDCVDQCLHRIHKTKDDSLTRGSLQNITPTIERGKDAANFKILPQDLVALLPQCTCSSVGPTTQPLPLRWSVKFSRYGRGGKSGLDEKDKREKLTHFSSILKAIPGPIDLKHPEMELLYLEDWHGYMEEFHRYEQRIAKEQTKEQRDINDV